jgi:hypothetical protein
MIMAGIKELKNQLSRYIALVKKGDDVRIIFFLPVTTKNWGRPPGPRVWRRCLLQPPAGADKGKPPGFNLPSI